MSRKVVVIGGGPAGIVAAVTGRRYYQDAEITLIRKEEKVLIPCGIPYIFGTLASPEKNLIPDNVLSNNNINLIIDEVTSVNKVAKEVITTKGGTFNYD